MAILFQLFVRQLTHQLSSHNNPQPFCGSGTILLEALDVYQKQIKCVGMDVSRRSANGARENAVAEGFGDDLCQFHCCDARNFRRKLEVDSVNAIVSLVLI